MYIHSAMASEHPCHAVHCMYTSGPFHQALVHAQVWHPQPPAGLSPAWPLANSASLVFSGFWRSGSLAQKARGAFASLEPLHICPLASMVPASVIAFVSRIVTKQPFKRGLGSATIGNGVVQSQHQVQGSRSESSTVRWCGCAIWAHASTMDTAIGCCHSTLHDLQVLKMGCRELGCQTTPE